MKKILWFLLWVLIIIVVLCSCLISIENFYFGNWDFGQRMSAVLGIYILTILSVFIYYFKIKK